MRAEDLIELLEERPFIPLRIHLSDRRAYVVRHPEMAIVANEIVAIGLPPDGGLMPVERITHCATAHIVEAEPTTTT